MLVGTIEDVDNVLFVFFCVSIGIEIASGVVGVGGVESVCWGWCR